MQASVTRSHVSIMKFALVWLATSMAIPSAFAVPVNSLYTAVWDSADGYTIDQTQTSNTGAVNNDASTGSCPTSVSGGSSHANCGKVAGSADFGVLKARSYASSGNYINRTATSTAKTSYQVTIEADPAFSGSHGPILTLGDYVDLNLSFRLDGILNSGAGAGDTTGSTEMSTRLKIVDPSILLDCSSPDGCYTPQLMEFRSRAGSITYGSSGETYNNWDWYLNTRDAMDNLIDAQSDSDSWIISPGSTCLSAPCNDIDFDTGILSTTIKTRIGATLDINGSLDIFSQSWDFSGNGAYGSGNFMDTFGVVFTPATEGVLLSYGGITPAPYDLAPPTSAPEPTTVALLTLGLAGLGYARRRKLV